MQNEFYIVVATILPVLFLAVTIQSAFALKMRSYTKSESFQANVHAMSAIAMVAIVGLGEFVALRNVYTGNENDNDLFVIIISLLLPTLIVTSEYVLHLINRSKELWYITFMLIPASGIVILARYLL